MREQKELELIMKFVENKFELREGILKERTKVGKISEARRMYYYLSKQLVKKATQGEIAKVVGRNPSTVSYSIKTSKDYYLYEINRGENVLRNTLKACRSYLKEEGFGIRVVAKKISYQRGGEIHGEFFQRDFKRGTDFRQIMLWAWSKNVHLTPEDIELVEY